MTIPFLSFVLVFIVSSVALVSPGWSMSPAEYSKLKSGQVVVHPKANGETSKAIEASVLIQRPVNQVWNVLKNTEQLFASDPSFKKVEVLERPSPTRQIVQYNVKFSPLLPMMTYIGQVDFIPQKGTVFKRISGNFKAMDGRTTLQPGHCPSETILTYKLYVDPGVPVPQTIVNRFVGADLPKSLNRLKQRVYQLYPANTVAVAN
jgi:carbon monoxide dehydrogenase subunit G